MKLYSFIRGSLEWPFSELILSDASLWNQYKFIAVIYFNILIIAVIPNEQQIN